MYQRQVHHGSDLARPRLPSGFERRDAVNADLFHPSAVTDGLTRYLLTMMSAVHGGALEKI